MQANALQGLADRFAGLWGRCVPRHGSDASDAWQQLCQRYAEPHRRYHTLTHVARCLAAFDQAGTHIVERDAVELGIWFHDSVFEVGRADNEARSAALFRRLALPAMPERRVRRVEDLILATRHVALAPDLGSRYLVDIDLSSLGRRWSEFRADSERLRAEAPHTPERQYCVSKLRFFDGLLAREHIYQTRFFRDLFETRARRNVERHVAELEARLEALR